MAMACIGSEAISLSHSNQKFMKMAKIADISSCNRVQCWQSNQSTQSKFVKAETYIANARTRAPLRRMLMFQILAVVGTMLCRVPLVADGLVRANEKRSNLLSDSGDISGGEVVLQGIPYTAKLERPSTSHQIQEVGDTLEEVLSVRLKLYRSKASAFRVFINLPDANEQTPVTLPEFGGSYFHEPRRVKSPDYEFQITTFQIGIGEIIKDLGLESKSSILITFVPCGADKGLPIVLEQIELELE